MIVWDALVDADLVSGWLAESTITPELDGRYELRWSHRQGQPVTSGRITALTRFELLQVDAADLTCASSSRSSPVAIAARAPDCASPWRSISPSLLDEIENSTA